MRDLNILGLKVTQTLIDQDKYDDNDNNNVDNNNKNNVDNNVDNNNVDNNVDNNDKNNVDNNNVDNDDDDVDFHNIKNFNNNEYLSYFQKNVDTIINNCLNSLDISSMYDDTKEILNNILLSKYKAEKDNVIKKYINEDIKNMSLEEIDKTAQSIYEKRKVLLTKLLLLFKKNVDTQINNETSDLRKDRSIVFIYMHRTG